MPMTIDGSGTIAGLVSGGLPDATITKADLVEPLTLGTSQATTSGTFRDFTGIPSWVKRITVMFSGVSTNGSSNPLIQVGSGSVTTSGYLGACMNSGNAQSPGIANFTNGFGINGASAQNTYHGLIVICLVTGSTYTASGQLSRSDSTSVFNMSGSVSLSGPLDRVRITTVNGTDTFDAGSINILYE